MAAQQPAAQRGHMHHSAWVELCSGTAHLSGQRSPRIRAGACAPAPASYRDERLALAVQQAYSTGAQNGERLGYVAGWRWGAVCGFVFGALVGSGVVALALYLGAQTVAGS